MKMFNPGATIKESMISLNEVDETSFTVNCNESLCSLIFGPDEDITANSSMNNIVEDILQTHEPEQVVPETDSSCTVDDTPTEKKSTPFLRAHRR